MGGGLGVATHDLCSQGLRYCTRTAGRAIIGLNPYLEFIQTSKSSGCLILQFYAGGAGLVLDRCTFENYTFCITLSRVP